MRPKKSSLASTQPFMFVGWEMLTMTLCQRAHFWPPLSSMEVETSWCFSAKGHFTMLMGGAIPSNPWTFKMIMDGSSNGIITQNIQLRLPSLSAEEEYQGHGETRPVSGSQSSRKPMERTEVQSYQVTATKSQWPSHFQGRVNQKFFLYVLKSDQQQQTYNLCAANKGFSSKYQFIFRKKISILIFLNEMQVNV